MQHSSRGTSDALGGKVADRSLIVGTAALIPGSGGPDSNRSATSMGQSSIAIRATTVMHSPASVGGLASCGGSPIPFKCGPLATVAPPTRPFSRSTAAGTRSALALGRRGRGGADACRFARPPRRRVVVRQQGQVLAPLGYCRQLCQLENGPLVGGVRFDPQGEWQRMICPGSARGQPSHGA